MHAPSNQSKCKKNTRSSLQNARQRREFKHAIKILQMQNKWNGGLRDHNQNPLMSNQQKFTNVERWGIISNGKSIENISKRRMRKSRQRKEKRREKKGPRNENWRYVTLHNSCPNLTKRLVKKARLAKKEKKKKGKEWKNGRMEEEKEKRREERSKKPPQDRSLNDAY